MSAGARLALATPHRLGQEAGVTAFHAGGTALAAAAVLTVVAPQDRALGGDAIALAGIPDGTSTAAGQRLRQPALARSLRTLADGGANAFYDGALGATLVEVPRAVGSALRRKDVAAHATELTTPLLGGYAGVEVATAQFAGLRATARWLTRLDRRLGY